MSNQGASKSGIGGRYASALFELATEAGAADAVEAELRSLGQTIASTSELSGFLKSPVYDREDQARAIAEMAKKAGFSELTSNFLNLVAKNRRLFSLPGMIAAYISLATEARGEVTAEAVAAQPLTDEQEKALRLEIETKVGKAVNLETRVDPNLLGGLVVKIGSQMIDSSLRTKLNRLKTVMKEA